ncbi:Uncharacterized protein dnm_013430 [Desulfonema magnum]|uniref:Uncharacterized protein n=1 Tax=Desulfonema magnum TaxID=45655 RepID=A0A975BHD2_9BACT|nr:Uncharacterized protein dnm_013430 [Desulfonema magnum]
MADRICVRRLADSGREAWERDQKAPENEKLVKIFQNHPFSGNLRDLQRLASLIMAWWARHQPETAISKALTEWQRWENTGIISGESRFGHGSRRDRIRWFQAELDRWAKKKYGTWVAAAKSLQCDEKTLRKDAIYDNESKD